MIKQYYKNMSLRNIKGEIWKDVPGFEGFYKVSNKARIKSVERVDCMGQRRKPLIKKQGLDRDGYLSICLAKDRVNFRTHTHRLVAKAFVDNKNDYPQVNHKDGIKMNNLPSNLEWCTIRQNIHHSINVLGSTRVGELNGAAFLSNKQVLEIFKMDGRGVDIASKFKINPLIVSRIKRGYNWGKVTGKEYTRKKIK